MSNPTAEKRLAPERQIAPYTTVRVMPSDEHVQITQNSEHNITLDREACAMLVEWLDKAGFSGGVDDLWPGIKP